MEPNEELKKEAGDSESYTTIDKQCIGKDIVIEQEGAIKQEVDSSSMQTTLPDKDTGCNPDDKTTNDKQDEHDHDGADEDEDLEEGELKDDDDDDDDDDEDEANNASSNTRFSIFNNDNNNNSNTSGLNKGMSSGDQRLNNDPNHHNNTSNYSASNDATRGSHNHRPYHRQQHNRRHFSPNNQNHPGSMQHHNFSPNQNHFPNNSNNNLYGFQPAHDGGGGPPPTPMMLPQMNHHPAAGLMPGDMYPVGMPGNMGPVQKVNVRCRFYSKTNNKCTWGDECRFEHRDDSPEPNEAYDDRLVGPDGGPMRGPPQGPAPPMGVHERVYPPYRHQPYPAPMPPHAYGYGAYEHPPYGPHHSNSPPLPAQPAPPPHWRQQHSPYPPPSSNHPPQSISPSILSSSSNAQTTPRSGPGGSLPSSQPMSGAPMPAAPSSGGAPSPGYSSPSSSAVYERKHRLAYAVAPWNDRGYPPSRYDRGEPAAGYHPASARGGYYRGQYGRDPYGREPPPHAAAAPYPYQYDYHPNHPSAYRGGPPMGSHAPHYRYSSSSQRNVPPDSRRSRSNKRARDGDSSWSDTGSDDSMLGEASSSSRSHANKLTKRDEYQRVMNQASNNTAADKSADPEQPDEGGSGTPPGEPIPEDRERTEALLNKLKTIEDMLAEQKKDKQDDTL